MNQSIKLGVYHWQLFAGTDSFYPDDLPEDWRLSYFSNEFESACIDAGWILENPVLWGDMIEDLDDRFTLAIGLESAHQWNRLHDVTELPAQVDMLLLEKDEKGLGSGFELFHQGNCWSPEHPVISRLALLPSDASLKQYRLWIEQWIESNHDSEQALLLWLDGAKTPYRQLGELRSLIELMGY